MKVILKHRRDPKHFVGIEVRKGKVMKSRQGMVILVKNTHHSATRVRPDVLENDYIIPDSISLD